MNACSCGFRGPSADAYIKHCRFVHQNEPNFQYKCPVASCSLKSNTFLNLKSLSTHTIKFHTSQRFQGAAAQLQQEAIYKCQILVCQQQFDDLQKLKKHLVFHIESGIAVKCPFLNCTNSFNSVNSFRSHISRYHKDDLGIAVEYVNAIGADFIDESVEENDGDQIEDNIPDNNEEFESQLLKKAALLYIQLQAKYHLPNKTIQFLIDNVVELHGFADEHRIKEIRELLLEDGFESDNIDQIVDSLRKSNIFKDVHKTNLRSEHCRMGLYKSLFNYVEPVELLLGQNERTNKNCYMHYIPIKETLKNLLSDQSVYEQYTNQDLPEDGVFSDWTSGSCYKKSSFAEDDTAIRLILYQDAFEVVNPLGSARKKHKLLGVYMSLGNIHTFNRSKIDQMQLVLLCKESDYKQFPKEVFQPIITDLLDLEENGFIGPEGNTIHCFLCMICGDNLGSHGIGGFLESFSANYFCRFCCIHKQHFSEDPVSVGEPRTKRHYEGCVNRLHLDPNGVSVMGIKGNSQFNQLRHFHVCDGLPPCLGHDLFEGVVSYDVMLYLKYMINTEKWFDADLLNKRITEFGFHGTDKGDIPAQINITSKRLSGHAVQNWTFIRFLPLLIWDKVDTDDDVWRVLLKLQEITGLVTAPKLSVGQVEHLQTCTEEYLLDRARLFPDTALRPKHHFLLHYSELTLRFGPLIWVWTMRFESKHKYFKYVIASSQNFINVSKTLSTRHQMLQASYSTSRLYPPKLQVKHATEFSMEFYNQQFQSCLLACPRFCAENQHIVSIAHDVRYKGTDYKKGQIIVTSVINWQKVRMGVIQCALLCEQSLYFVVKLQEFERDAAINLFKMANAEDHQSSLLCLMADDLPYNYPLALYNKFRCDYVVPKSAFLD